MNQILFLFCRETDPFFFCCFTRRPKINLISPSKYRIQAYDSIMCGYFCIGFVDFILKSKSLLDYTNLFSLNDYEKNDKIVLKYFPLTKKLKKIYCVICSKYRKFEKPKIYLLEKAFAVSARMKMKSYFNKKNQLRS